MSEIDPHRELERYVNAFKNQKLAAAGLKISESYLTDLLMRRRPFSDAMLEKLGLKRINKVVKS